MGTVHIILKDKDHKKVLRAKNLAEATWARILLEWADEFESEYRGKHRE